MVIPVFLLLNLFYLCFIFLLINDVRVEYFLRWGQEYPFQLQVPHTKFIPVHPSYRLMLHLNNTKAKKNFNIGYLRPISAMSETLSYFVRHYVLNNLVYNSSLKTTTAVTDGQLTSNWDLQLVGGGICIMHSYIRVLSKQNVVFGESAQERHGLVQRSHDQYTIS